MSRPGGFQGRGGPGDNYRIGRRIRVPEVRVIGADGAQVGVLPTQDALRMAEEAGLELVEVSPSASPPVCRIMDFGKFKYEQSKKEKESRKHQTQILVKEVKLRPKTDVHDLEFKIKHLQRFLAEGNKCRLVVAFRGREIVHPETGQAMLDHVVRLLGDAAQVEQRPAMEGRRIVMIIGPKMGVIKRPGAGDEGGGAAPLQITKPTQFAPGSAPAISGTPPPPPGPPRRKH